MSEPTYWLDLFTGTTWNEFVSFGSMVSGFREKRWNAVKKIKAGDFLVCYLTGVMRWVGLLQVTSEAYKDASPIWKSQVFPCRLKVKPLISLTPESAVPMSEVIKGFGAPDKWGGLVRGSPTRIPSVDGQVIHKALEAAQKNPVIRPVDPKKLARVPVLYKTKIGPVTIPVEETPIGLEATVTGEGGVSHEEIQWLLLKLGNDTGLDVWVAKNDKNRKYKGNILSSLPHDRKELPHSFDEGTARTIELIDVLWLHGNAIVSAFEVEHSTSIYSGLLRMADLISMQPNLKINLFIVAPDERREKVIEEINRPIFTKLSPPLNAVCRFIPYSALKTRLAQAGDLTPHLKPTFVLEIAESCEATQ